MQTLVIYSQHGVHTWGSDRVAYNLQPCLPVHCLVVGTKCQSIVIFACCILHEQISAICNSTWTQFWGFIMRNSEIEYGNLVSKIKGIFLFHFYLKLWNEETGLNIEA